MAEARWPRAVKRSASSRVAVLVRTKIITPSYVSISRIRVSASSLCTPLTSQYFWRMFSILVVLALINISDGLFKNRLVILSISLGMVAENNAICRFSGACSRIHSTSSIKPMRNISSASSNTMADNVFRFKLPRLMWSMILPGVPTTT